jgi:hypothetical protein
MWGRGIEGGNRRRTGVEEGEGDDIGRESAYINRVILLIAAAAVKCCDSRKGGHEGVSSAGLLMLLLQSHRTLKPLPKRLRLKKMISARV